MPSISPFGLDPGFLSSPTRVFSLLLEVIQPPFLLAPVLLSVPECERGLWFLSPSPRLFPSALFFSRTKVVSVLRTVKDLDLQFIVTRKHPRSFVFPLPLPGAPLTFPRVKNCVPGTLLPLSATACRSLLTPLVRLF